jgi:large subunit ribosomal protein L49
MNFSPVPRTVIRHIEGDVGEFKNELSKVVSNAPIIEKVLLILNSLIL